MNVLLLSSIASKQPNKGGVTVLFFLNIFYSQWTTMVLYENLECALHALNTIINTLCNKHNFVITECQLQTPSAHI